MSRARPANATASQNWMSAKPTTATTAANPLTRARVSFFVGFDDATPNKTAAPINRAVSLISLLSRAINPAIIIAHATIMRKRKNVILTPPYTSDAELYNIVAI